MRGLGVVPPARALVGATDSGLVKLTRGQSKALADIGAFRLSFACGDDGGGHAKAHLLLQNRGAQPAQLSSNGGSYTTVGFAAGATTEVGYRTTTDPGTYFLSGGYQTFDVVGSDGAFIHGDGMLGVNVGGADCVTAVWTTSSPPRV